MFFAEKCEVCLHYTDPAGKNPLYKGEAKIIYYTSKTAPNNLAGNITLDNFTMCAACLAKSQSEVFSEKHEAYTMLCKYLVEFLKDMFMWNSKLFTTICDAEQQMMLSYFSTTGLETSNWTATVSTQLYAYIPYTDEEKKIILNDFIHRLASEWRTILFSWTKAKIENLN